MTGPLPSVILDGAPLDAATLRQVLAGPVRPEWPEAATARVAAGRAVLEQALAAGQPIYGATTGVGAMKHTEHRDGAAIAAFNAGLAFAHQVAVGEEVAPGVVRLMLALRLNTLATGRVGVTPGFVQRMVAMLRADLLPVVQARGSVGCGDLGQMGQLAAVMAGQGAARLAGVALPAAEACAQAGLAPYVMQPRESLAAVGSNAFGLARSAAAVLRAGDAMRQAMGQAAVTAVAWGLDRAVWRAARHSLIPGEAAMAGWLEAALDDQRDWPQRSSVHDALSGRFLVQILAASLSAAEDALRAVLRHSAHVDDNPVICDGQVVTSGASLLCDLSARMAALHLAMAQLGRNVFNRCLMLSNGSLPGLTVNLVPPGVIGTGYGPLMKLAQEQAVRLNAAAAPVATLNLTLAAGLEDEALLIPLAAERLEAQAEALEWLLTVEALLAGQALELRGVLPGRMVARHMAVLRAHIPPFTGDMPLSAPLTALRESLCCPKLRAELRALAPFLPFDAEMAMPQNPAGGGNLPLSPRSNEIVPRGPIQ